MHSQLQKNQPPNYINVHQKQGSQISFKDYITFSNLPGNSHVQEQLKEMTTFN